MDEVLTDEYQKKLRDYLAEFRQQSEKEQIKQLKQVLKKTIKGQSIKKAFRTLVEKSKYTKANQTKENYFKDYPAEKIVKYRELIGAIPNYFEDKYYRTAPEKDYYTELTDKEKSFRDKQNYTNPKNIKMNSLSVKHPNFENRLTVLTSPAKLISGKEIQYVYNLNRKVIGFYIKDKKPFKINYTDYGKYFLDRYKYLLKE
jgi:hypothetical protein